MAPDRGAWDQLIREIALTAAISLSGYLLVRHILKQINLDPEAAHHEQARIKSATILRRLDETHTPEESLETNSVRPRREELVLSTYEQVILQDLVFPADIPVSFDDIGGMSTIIEELRESVIYPLTMPGLYSRSSSLLSAPSGVLLYGPPGCGKTMIAKALARESGACFINLHISTLTEKWFGDSNKLVNAVFTLARKLQPTIVFIDEIDAVLGSRRTGEHEASGMVKAEWMTHWDGLASASSTGQPQRILVLGATNRIQDIDDAILRRMPKKFPVTLPTASQRSKILRLVLKDTKIDRANFDFDYIVKVMAGMSGSEMKEACRDAAMVPVREMLRERRERGQPMSEVNGEEIRGIRTQDFFGRAGSTQLMSKSTRKVKDTTGEREWDTESSSPEGDSDMEDAQEEVVRS